MVESATKSNNSGDTTILPEQFYSSRSKLIHSGRSKMDHFILVGVDWTISFWLTILVWFQLFPLVIRLLV